MNELIKIDYNSDRPTVLGRDLHAALEVQTAYKDWFPRMCEYGFTEGTDFCSFLSESTGGRPATDHQLTIAMAKEVCMIQRTEKGKECRQYFIRIEEAWNDPATLMARALQSADKQIKQLQEKVRTDAPKVLFSDAVTAAHTTILIGELAKLLKQNGIEIGEKRLFAWLRDNGYLIKRKGTDFNSPTQKAMDMGLFSVKETAITHSDGHVSVSKTTKVTGKGQLYFVNKFLASKETA